MARSALAAVLERVLRAGAEGLGRGAGEHWRRLWRGEVCRRDGINGGGGVGGSSDCVIWVKASVGPVSRGIGV